MTNLSQLNMVIQAIQTQLTSLEKRVFALETKKQVINFDELTVKELTIGQKLSVDGKIEAKEISTTGKISANEIESKSSIKAQTIESSSSIKGATINSTTSITSPNITCSEKLDTKAISVSTIEKYEEDEEEDEEEHIKFLSSVDFGDESHQDINLTISGNGVANIPTMNATTVNISPEDSNGRLTVKGETKFEQTSSEKIPLTVKGPSNGTAIKIEESGKIEAKEITVESIDKSGDNNIKILSSVDLGDSSDHQNLNLTLYGTGIANIPSLNAHKAVIGVQNSTENPVLLVNVNSGGTGIKVSENGKIYIGDTEINNSSS